MERFTIEEELLTIDEVAEVLKLHPETTRLKIARGEIPGALKIGGTWRVRRHGLEDWITEGGN